MNCRGLLPLACGVLVSATLAAQSQAPVFRAEANYIQVTAVVTGADGKFITGLTAGDFEVKEDFKTQTVSALTLIDLPISQTSPPAPDTSATVYDPTLPAELRLANRRIYLLYLNMFGRGTATDLHAARAARRFVTDHLMPGDVAAIWDPQSRANVIEFTSDKDPLVAKLDAIDRGGLVNQPIDAGRHLKSAVEWMSAMQNRRKAIVLFGGGLTMTPEASSIATFMTRPGRAGHELRPASDMDIINRADVQIYPVDVRGLIAPNVGAIGAGGGAQIANAIHSQMSLAQGSVDTLKSVAEETGGIAVVNTNDYRAGFQRIVEDNSRYYVLGYQSASTSKDRRFHPISVTLTRKDLDGARVRARKGYLVQ
jgi:VWFA-related protein